MRRLASLILVASAMGCSDDAVQPAGPTTNGGTQLVLDLDADLADSARFFDVPWPFDLRLDAAGAPDLDGWPNPGGLSMIDGLVEIGRERAGFPTVPVAYLRFTAPLPALDLGEVIAAQASAPIFFADVDPDSPDRGALVPTVATLLGQDDYVRGHVLAVAPRPGFVLLPETTYAVVVRRSLGDATGAPLAVAPALAELLAGKAPPGPRGTAAAAAFEPLLETLGTLQVPIDEVAAATVFTTGHVVARAHELSSAIVEAHPVTIEGLALDPDDGSTHERFCELHGTVRYPQFQRGTPPFDTEGTFLLGADGLPVVQREEEAPVVITIPKAPMPAGGFPLMIYFHGSGGVAAQVVDRGPTVDGVDEKGKGPAHVMAAHGFATAASALPVNPERLPGASDTAYLNVDNLAAFRDTFRQGLIEQRLLMEALRTLALPPELLAACAGPALPPAQTTFRFAEDQLVAMGQSMGGLYTNLIAPTEPRVRAVVPTGAGGFWSYFILETSLLPGAKGLIAVLLGTDVELTFVHPALSLLELAWEPAEPIAYVPFLARRPLDGHPARAIYEPVGQGDSYFPESVYDAMALAYGNEQAGDEVWSTMQPALALDGREGLLPYPVEDNLSASSGAPYTGVVVQYAGDGEHDPHTIAFQLDEVKYQYGCFLATFLARGAATVPAPAPLGTPCP